MPAAVRGSPVLLALAFAPFAVMLFWLVRLRLGPLFRRPFRLPAGAPRHAAEAPEPLPASV
jgi:hypothetical protein